MAESAHQTDSDILNAAMIKSFSSIGDDLFSKVLGLTERTNDMPKTITAVNIALGKILHDVETNKLTRERLQCLQTVLQTWWKGNRRNIDATSPDNQNSGSNTSVAACQAVMHLLRNIHLLLSQMEKQKSTGDDSMQVSLSRSIKTILENYNDDDIRSVEDVLQKTKTYINQSEVDLGSGDAVEGIIEYILQTMTSYFHENQSESIPETPRQPRIYREHSHARDDLEEDVVGGPRLQIQRETNFDSQRDTQRSTTNPYVPTKTYPNRDDPTRQLPSDSEDEYRDERRESVGRLRKRRGSKIRKRSLTPANGRSKANPCSIPPYDWNERQPSRSKKVELGDLVSAALLDATKRHTNMETRMPKKQYLCDMTNLAMDQLIDKIRTREQTISESQEIDVVKNILLRILKDTFANQIPVGTMTKIADTCVQEILPLLHKTETGRSARDEDSPSAQDTSDRSWTTDSVVNKAVITSVRRVIDNINRGVEDLKQMSSMFAAIRAAEKNYSSNNTNIRRKGDVYQDPRWDKPTKIARTSSPISTRSRVEKKTDEIKQYKHDQQHRNRKSVDTRSVQTMTSGNSTRQQLSVRPTHEECAKELMTSLTNILQSFGNTSDGNDGHNNDETTKIHTFTNSIESLLKKDFIEDKKNKHTVETLERGSRVKDEGSSVLSREDEIIKLHVNDTRSSDITRSLNNMIKASGGTCSDTEACVTRDVSDEMSSGNNQIYQGSYYPDTTDRVAPKESTELQSFIYDLISRSYDNSNRTLDRQLREADIAESENIDETNAKADHVNFQHKDDKPSNVSSNIEINISDRPGFQSSCRPPAMKEQTLSLDSGNDATQYSTETGESASRGPNSSEKEDQMTVTYSQLLQIIQDVINQISENTESNTAIPNIPTLVDKKVKMSEHVMTPPRDLLRPSGMLELPGRVSSAEISSVMADDKLRQVIKMAREGTVGSTEIIKLACAESSGEHHSMAVAPPSKQSTISDMSIRSMHDCRSNMMKEAATCASQLKTNVNLCTMQIRNVTAICTDELKREISNIREQMKKDLTEVLKTPLTSITDDISGRNKAVMPVRKDSAESTKCGKNSKKGKGVVSRRDSVASGRSNRDTVLSDLSDTTLSEFSKPTLDSVGRPTTVPFYDIKRGSISEKTKLSPSDVVAAVGAPMDAIAKTKGTAENIRQQMIKNRWKDVCMKAPLARAETQSLYSTGKGSDSRDSSLKRRVINRRDSLRGDLSLPSPKINDIASVYFDVDNTARMNRRYTGPFATDGKITKDNVSTGGGSTSGRPKSVVSSVTSSLFTPPSPPVPLVDNIASPSPYPSDATMVPSSIPEFDENDNAQNSANENDNDNHENDSNTGENDVVINDRTEYQEEIEENMSQNSVNISMEYYPSGDGTISDNRDCYADGSPVLVESFGDNPVTELTNSNSVCDNRISDIPTVNTNEQPNIVTDEQVRVNIRQSTVENWLQNVSAAKEINVEVKAPTDVSGKATVSTTRSSDERKKKLKPKQRSKSATDQDRANVVADLMRVAGILPKKPISPKRTEPMSLMVPSKHPPPKMRPPQTFKQSRVNEPKCKSSGRKTGRTSRRPSSEMTTILEHPPESNKCMGEQCSTITCDAPSESSTVYENSTTSNTNGQLEVDNDARSALPTSPEKSSSPVEPIPRRSKKSSSDHDTKRGKGNDKQRRPSRK